MIDKANDIYPDWMFGSSYLVCFVRCFMLMLFLFAQELIPNTSIAYVDSFTF